MLKPKRPWWKQTTVYQIYPRSFHDANGDGVGDLAGIIAKLDYIKSLGVETIWSSPFYQSPQADFGYDISDHFDIHPEYGTLQDCRLLIDEVHARGMKIVLDMVLNHTSDQHPWFQESRRSRTDPRRDFYIWRDGRGPGGRLPPNNWRSMLGARGWHRDSVTGQWYWASFLPCQPDLNYRNPEVKRTMLDVVRHWLEQGADGLRLDIFNALYKDPSFADNPLSLRALPSQDDLEGFFQKPRHTLNHPDTLAFARELRAVVDEFTDPPRFLVGEVFGPTPVLRRYCGGAGVHDGLHLVFLFKTLRTAFSAAAFRGLIHELERAFAEPLLPTYVFGNHDQPRSMARLGDDPEKAKLLAALQLTLRGVPFIYYGEEIGMPQHAIPLAQARDPLAARFRFLPQWLAGRLPRLGIGLNRDECRQPMQWHAGANAGFAPPHATPWLPVHRSSAVINVAAQERDPRSLLSCYRRLLGLRRQRAALHSGDLQMKEAARGILSYRRRWASAHGGHPEVVDVHLNFEDRENRVALDGQRRLLFSTREPGDGDTGALGGVVHVLRPYEGIVVGE